MALITLLEELGSSDGLTKLISAGGSTGAVCLFLWRLFPLAARLFERQTEFVDHVDKVMTEVRDSQRRSEDREERLMSAVARLPCNAMPMPAPVSHSHPAPEGVGHSTSTQANP